MPPGRVLPAALLAGMTVAAAARVPQPARPAPPESPFQLAGLAALREFLVEGRAVGNRFYSVGRFPVIVTPAPVALPGFQFQGRDPDGQAVWSRYDLASPSPADRFLSVYENFVALLGPDAAIRAGWRGPVFGFNITPRSGRPAPSFFLACRASTLRPGRANGDLLETRLRLATQVFLRGAGLPDRLREELDATLAALTPVESALVRRCLGIVEDPVLPAGSVPDGRTPDGRISDGRATPFVLNSFEAYEREIKASRQRQGAVVLVGRGMVSARSGLENVASADPLPPGHPEVYTVDADPAAFPDLVADVRKPDALVSIPDHSVDQIRLDGMASASLFDPGLAEVLASKLKPGGLYIGDGPPPPTDSKFVRALRSHGFRGPAPLAPGEDWMGHGSPFVFTAPR
jgi:hypothetical protein